MSRRRQAAPLQRRAAREQRARTAGDNSSEINYDSKPKPEYCRGAQTGDSDPGLVSTRVGYRGRASCGGELPTREEQEPTTTTPPSSRSQGSEKIAVGNNGLTSGVGPENALNQDSEFFWGCLGLFNPGERPSCGNELPRSEERAPMATTPKLARRRQL